MATGTNNNVGKNDIPALLKDDIHFDLAPGTTGVDAQFGLTGKLYDLAAIEAIILARGAKYQADGSLFAAGDTIVEVEVDLKPMGGEGINEGDDTNPISVATTSQALYKNNGSWTDIDPMGGRNDGEEETTVLPTSVEEIFVENDSIVTVHITFQKAA